MENNTVSFWTTGKDFTSLVRQLWESETPKNALECLDGLDMPVRVSILEGSMRLEGDTRDNPELSVVEDSYEGIPAQKLLRRIMRSWAKSIALQDGRGASRNAEQALYLNNAIRAYANIHDEIGKLSEQEKKLSSWSTIEEGSPAMQQAKDFSKEGNPEMAAIAAEATTRSLLGIDPPTKPKEPSWSDKAVFATLDTVQVMIIQQTKTNGRDLSIDHKLFQKRLWEENGLKKENPKETKYNSGFISPKGDFYGCPDMAHVAVSEELCKLLSVAIPAEAFRLGSAKFERALEQLGWITLSSGRAVYRKDDNPLIPTIEQWEAVLAWMDNPINKESSSSRRIYVTDTDTYFPRHLIEQNIVTEKSLRSGKK